MAIKAIKKKQTKVPSKFVLDCSIPTQDQILDTAAFEKYLHDRIKVDGRTNNLGEKISIARTSSSITVTVTPNLCFSKRYLKYLTKKFLKKNQLRDFVRVVATDKATFTLKYFQVNNGEEAEEEKNE